MEYDVVLKKDNIKLVMCDQFYEGLYNPNNNEIVLCANILMNKTDFENSIARQLVFMYDYNRIT